MINFGTLKKKLSKISWIIYSVIFNLLNIWFLIIQIFAKDFGWFDENGKLNRLIYIISIILVIIWTLIIIVKAKYDTIKQTYIFQGQDVLKEAINANNKDLKENILKFTRYIMKNNTSYENAFYTLTDISCDNLIEDLIICVSKITGIDRSNIGVSILCNFDYANKKWFYLCKKNLSNSMSAERIISNSDSTARLIVDGKRDFVVFPNKKDAFERNRFVPDIKDQESDMRGSIICKDVSVNYNDTKIIRAVLSITTYKEQICDNSKESEEKLEKFIINPFESKIKYLLCLHYLRSKDATMKKINKKKNISSIQNTGNTIRIEA